MKPSHLLIAFSLLLAGASCTSTGENNADSDAPGTDFTPAEIKTAHIRIGQKDYDVADIIDSSRVYRQRVDKSKCFIVISKQEYRLYVYEITERGTHTDTMLCAHYPVCYGKNPAAKTQRGDMATPESGMDSPFVVSEIKDASSWCHNFGDGRGDILSYGAWFIRLKTGEFTGIGIHGSTNNVESVPGRDSEGCIRLRDEDLLQLHDNYVSLGMPVIIKGLTQDKLPFEQKAERALGKRYLRPVPGNPNVARYGVATAAQDSASVNS